MHACACSRIRTRILVRVTERDPEDGKRKFLDRKKKRNREEWIGCSSASAAEEEKIPESPRSNKERLVPNKDKDTCKNTHRRLFIIIIKIMTMICCHDNGNERGRRGNEVILTCCLCSKHNPDSVIKSPVRSSVSSHNNPPPPPPPPPFENVNTAQHWESLGNLHKQIQFNYCVLLLNSDMFYNRRPPTVLMKSTYGRGRAASGRAYVRVPDNACTGFSAIFTASLS